ncbi:SDR family NAD(P)-dependent oxidoreductase [Ascidiimonas sp. W6]|uniref:SDR family NAD(P)-dependent oxidoreductase n=1 Tax=Ascidiimonas meishanensis TaxID=3128903 RepID=UPI0030EBA284
MTNKGIAIVGLDCRYPGANNPEQYWENILSLRQQFRRMPDKRLNLDYYFSEDKSNIDYTYSKKASVLQGYNFDRIKYKVSKSTFEQTDMAHWLALDVAYGALKDAGFENGEGLNKERTGVILGNSLNGEFTRANIMRLRWPYVFKVLESTLGAMNYSRDEITKILTGTEKVYKEPFPKPTADTLAGGLSNTIAGRICNYFDFNGGGFTVDGACSSSLLAFVNGCNSIVNNELDVALVGGIDLSIDPFEVIGFARNGALAATEMEVYSKKSSGFWPGEGCGVVVLMNEEEAIERGVNIYGVIRGWGISSDGNGGVTRPKPETQQMAFERAYQRAGYDIGSIAMFEGHGTGTALGDEVELKALAGALKKNNKAGNPAILGSVKHLIGHTKAAAGVAGLIKVCLSLKSRVIPASLKPSGLHDVLENNSDILQLAKQPIAYNKEEAMRASVSSMGFGGINVHLTLEEAATTKKHCKINKKIKKYSESVRDCEVFPISALSKEMFLKKIDRLQELAKDISRAEFIDLSATISQHHAKHGKWNCSIVASTPDELLDNLNLLKEVVDEDKKRFIETEKGIFFDSEGETKPIGFLFPGQGAPIYQNLGAFDNICKDILETKTEEFNYEGEVADTSVAQPAIVQRSLQSVELLDYYGINAVGAVGHSLGEIAALSWAGVYDDKTAGELARSRGEAMSAHGESGGAMLALHCDLRTVENLIYNYNVNITGYNGKNSFVVGGKENEINAVQELAFDKDIHNVKLKVSHAFHTPLMKNAALEFKKQLDKFDYNTINKNVFSTVFGNAVSKKVNFKEHLYRQIEQPVKFTQAIDELTKKAKVLIELGPGKALSKSLRDYDDLEVISLNFGADSLRDFLNVLSIAYISGSDVAFEELNGSRFFREIDVEEWKLDVLENPCEKTDHKSTIIRSIIEAAPTVEEANQTVVEEEQDLRTISNVDGVTEQLKNLISVKTELPLEAINADDRIMSQLHLNSLAITEIISIATKQFNKSHKVFSAASIKANADGTIQEISALIFDGESGGSTEKAKDTVDFESLPNWTNGFKRINSASKPLNITIDNGEGDIKFFGNTGLEKSFEHSVNTNEIKAGSGNVFVYKSSQAAEVLDTFVDWLKSDTIRNGRFAMLVEISEEKGTGDLRPVFRSFHQEQPDVAARYLQLHENLESTVDHLLNEIKSISSYKEIIYDSLGNRFESEYELYLPKSKNLKEALSESDVILATGGGKGITFESVRELSNITGASIAILGRSKPEKDEMLAENLRLLEIENINFKYYSTDVCDETAVKKTIDKTIKDLGKITMLMHGAGLNNPKRLELLTSEDFKRTESVKVGGLKNVLNAINLTDLKYLIGYGSIIAESGMQGNADYAWANDQLARLIEATGAENDHCKCFTLEWSVWDETGMGVSLNSIDSLKQQGVWPIPVKNGLEILKATISDPDFNEKRLVVSGRFGNIPTLIYKKEKLPLGRFVSKVKNYVPGVEIISEVHINLNDDIYLKNHVFQGQYVFPTVMILEGMAQLLEALTGIKGECVNFENLQINKSIFVPENDTNIVRFIVTRTSDTAFKAIVQSEDSNFEVSCFEAELLINSSIDATIDATFANDEASLSLEVGTKFYDDLLFHHGPFRRINGFKKIDALSSLAAANSSLKDEWFGNYLPAILSLGDPGLNDAAIHCHQACRPGFNLLPTSASSIKINSAKVEGPLFIHTVELREVENETVINVYIFNEKGEIKQYWKELVLTKVSGTAFSGEWDLNLLAPYIEYQLFTLTGDKSIKFTKKQCEDLVENASGDTHLGTFDLNGFSIILKREASSAMENHSMHEAIYHNSQLHISGLKDTYVLEIAQLSAVADK